MFGIGSWEIIAVALVVLVLFGSRLPKLMRSLGSSVTEFKKGVNEGTDEDEDGTVASEKTPSSESHAEAKS